MADYTYDSELIADPFSFQRAANASVTVYDVADGNNTVPLALKDLNGLNLPNPLTTSSDAFAPAFVAPAPQVKLVGGGLEVVKSSYAGIKEEAAASKVAAQAAAVEAGDAASTAAATVTAALAGAVSDAQTAATAATNAAALVGAPADAAIAAAVSGANSSTRAVLNATFRPKLDLVSKLKAPLFVSHRGAPTRYPEHSMEGYRASAQAGYPPEQDLQMLADGTLVSVHNSTTFATMTGPNVNVNSLNRAGWLSRRIKPAIVGGKTAKPVLWEDVLDEFGGRVVLFPEIKATTAGIAEAVIQSIVERGLERCVVVWSATYSVCQQLVAAGICTGYLTGTGSSAGAATWKADGIEFVAPSSTVTDQHFINFNNAGLKIVTYTPTTYAEAQTQIARGAFGVYVDDPWAISGNYLEANRQSFNDGYVWPGSLGVDKAVDQLAMLNDGRSVYKGINQNDSTTRYVEQGWAGELPSRSLTIDFDLTREAGMSTGSAARIYLSNTLRTSASETQPEWLMFMIRRTGEASIWKRTGNGTAGQVGVLAGFLPSLSSTTADTFRLRFAIDANGAASLTRLDTGAVLSVDAATMALSTNALWMSFGFKGMNPSYGNFAITKP